MENINIFEYAAENKLRFNYRGQITVEDLYDLTPQQLDTIYKNLKSEIRKQNDNEDSLLGTKSNEDISLTVSVEIIKNIVNKKLAQAEANKKAAENREQKKKLLAILEQKQDESLKNMSVEELQKAISELN